MGVVSKVEDAIWSCVLPQLRPGEGFVLSLFAY